MNTVQLLLWLQRGTDYLFDPSNRLMAIGLGLFVCIALGHLIIKSVKIVLIMAIIFLVIYFAIKYFATPI